MSIKIQISIESLMDAISALSIEEKQRIWQLLDVELNQTSEIEEDGYDWGVEGQPKGKQVEYIPEVGLVVIGGKNDPT